MNRILISLSMLLYCLAYAGTPETGNCMDGDRQARIVFVSFRDNNHEIYSMNEDGSDQTRLTSTSASEWDPCFSPDQKLIAYAINYVNDGKNSEIYIMNSDGSGVRKLTDLTTGVSSPRFTPDGKKLIFSEDMDGKTNIFALPLEGGKLEKITDIESELAQPSFSRDGKKVIFQYRGFAGENDLYIGTVISDGSGLLKIRDRSSYPCFSPDGSRIACFDFSKGPDQTGFILMDSTGKNESMMFKTSNPGGICFSRDGSRLIFSNADYVQHLHGTGEIYSIKLDGTDLKKLTCISDNLLPNAY
ncbi:MAG: hypothetical protein PHW04_14945 [Candidatus Wallbacteria bacterium]|nr:hypothetical protein [Candidatus Wallbacteria bacterium]